MIKYLPTHEYINVVDNDTALVGVSAYAARQLGNVVYVEAPEADEEFSAGEAFGAIESVKAASDLFAPLDMVIIEANDQVLDNSRLINEDALANWIVKVKILDPSQLDSLMDQDTYDAHCAAEH
ncbi:MAG: glycine cleavage system protein GcvH [Muribaculaceae bacterium]|nr:glycine cleavage system protein GcvH [Muribaculaceae bacterium]